MSLRVILNGAPIPLEEIQGDGGITVTITVEGEEGNTLVKTASGELTVYGSAYQTVKAELIDPFDGLVREIPIEFFDDCQEPWISVFKGVVRGDLVDFCDNGCSATFHAVEKTVESAAVDCVKSTLIWDNHNGFQGQNHPRMVYCDELRPDWLHQVVLIMGIILLLLFLILTPVVAVITVIIIVINAIIDAINVLPGVDIDHIDFDGDSSTNTLEEWGNLQEDLRLAIIGCGRRHISPLVRAYIGNVCSKCGLTFQSSILNNPASDYHDTVLFSAPVRKGTRDPAVLWQPGNRPNETLETLANKLGSVFNGGTRIIGTTFHFERRDKLPGGGIWVVPAELRAQKRLVGEVCYSARNDAPKAFLSIGFIEDGLDVVGNEANALYQDIVEWNQPFNAVQKGEKKKRFEFGMLRCRRDGVGGDILDSYLWADGVFFGGEIEHHREAMLLERGIAALPKLLVWNGDTNFGLVRRFDRSAVPGYGAYVKTPAENYNYPYHVGEFATEPNTAYEPDAPFRSLYTRFHAIDNPKVLLDRGRQFDFTFEKYTAAELTSMNPYADVPLSQGTGRITEITINLDQRTIFVAGKV